MKITRSSQTHFRKFITNKKKQELEKVMKEYSRIVNLFIGKYQWQIPQKTEFDLLKKEHIHSFDTWLSARLIKNAFSEGYGMVKSAKSNAKERQTHYIRPTHTGKKMILSETISTIKLNPKTKEFDMLVVLGCIGNKMKVTIPLKKNQHLNEFLNDITWKLSKSITLSKDYVQFSFEKEIIKKDNGKVVGIDLGINKLIATSDNQTFGDGYKELLIKLSNKKRGSIAYKKCKEEIREHIDYSIKQFPYKDYGLVIMEKLHNVHRNMKTQRRLSKNIRRVVSNWAYRYAYNRLMSACDLNCVRYRTVSNYKNSITCPNCNYADKRNRKSQEEFLCQKCNYSDNADYTASKIAVIRAITEPYGVCFKAIKSENNEVIPMYNFVRV